MKNLSSVALPSTPKSTNTVKMNVYKFFLIDYMHIYKTIGFENLFSN